VHFCIRIMVVVLGLFYSHIDSIWYEFHIIGTVIENYGIDNVHKVFVVMEYELNEGFGMELRRDDSISSWGNINE